MITYRPRTLPLDDERIPPDVLDYYWRTLRYALHAQFQRAFQSQARQPDFKLTKAKLARRLKRDKGWVTKKLAAPNNMTLKTVSDLLVGMGIDPVPPFRRLFAELALDVPEDSPTESASPEALEAVRKAVPGQSKAAIVLLADARMARRGEARQSHVPAEPAPDPSRESLFMAESALAAANQ